MAVDLAEIAPGVVMPLFGLGTWKLVSDEPEKETTQLLDAALQAGYRLFDTASMYKNEQYIGAALKALLPKHNLKRQDVFITTKMGGVEMGAKGSARKALEGSLARLDLDYIDLYLIHYPGKSFDSTDPLNPQLRKDTWLELEQILDEGGKVRSIGVSNFEVRHLKEMEAYASIIPAVNQCEYHPHFTRTQLVQYCNDKGIHFQAYGSLGRMEPDLLNDPVLQSVAASHSAPPAHVLLMFAYLQGISVIPKSSRPERLRDNFEALKVKLNANDIKQLSSLDRNKNYVPCTPWLVT